MKKKLLLTLLAVFLSILPTFVNAATEIDGICYNLNTRNKTAEVTGGGSYSGDIIIPESVQYNNEEYSVTSIGDYAFRDCSGLTSITIPNSVTSIGINAFHSCSGLTSITIPNSVTSIGTGAFALCSITSVNIPDGVTSIGRSTFSSCSSLTSVNIPVGVTNIGENAFYNCSALTSVNIPDDVTSIGDNAFYNCSALTSVNIPNSVTSIGEKAFYGCDGLESVTLNCPTVNKWFSNIASIKEIIIGNGVTSIANEAFAYCSGLTSVHISDLAAWCNISFGRVYSNPLYYAHRLFLNGTEVTDLVIPDCVTSIGEQAFQNCSGLISVTIPNSVTTIGGSAFSQCSNLTSVTIPNSVTSIGDQAFRNCSGLTSVTIPNSVTTIGGYTFSGCSGLTSVNISEGITSIGGYAFERCRGLTSVTIPNSVTTMEDYAFQNCSSLTTVTIGNGVTSIANGAFANCSGLTSVHISDLAAWCNISFGGVSANPLFYAHRLFLNGTEVTDLVIPDCVTSIGGGAFYGCSSLISVTIPNSVTSIGGNAFQGCSNLTNITIGSGVTTIGNYAFTSSNKLGLVVSLSITPPSGSQYNFWGDAGFRVLLMVPAGSEEAYANAVFWKDNNGIIPYEDRKTISFKDQNTKRICVEQWDTNGDGNLDTWEAMAVRDIGQTFTGNTQIIKFDEFQYFRGITTINSPFCNCSNLRTLTLPEGIQQISNPFDNCGSLTSINIPSSVIRIDGRNSFSGCSSLSAVHITNLTAWCNIVFSDSNNTNPLSVAHHLFLNGEEVTDLVIPDGVTSLSARAFEGCSDITSVTIPEGVTMVGSRAFQDCTGLLSLTIPSSMTIFSEDVFNRCSNLSAIDISDLSAWCNITFSSKYSNPLSQGHNLRLNGEKVTNLVIPNDVTEIGNYAFYGCTELTSVNIPEGVTKVGDNAFNTGSMKNVTIPSTLYSIGNTAFGNSLRSVAVKTNEPPLIGETAFPNRTSALLIVPQGSTAAYQDEMYWQDFKTILEYPGGGDVNLDGNINMVDVVDIVRFVVGTPSVNFIEVMADLNNSNSVNVADAVVLVNEIAGDVNYAKPMWAPVVDDDVLALAGDGNRLSLLMEGNGQYAAFQFDLWLPADLDVTDVQLNNSRRQGHQLLYNKVGSGHYRVAAISTAANSFSGNSGELLGLTLDGFANDDIRMDNIHFVTTRGADIAFDDLGVNHGSEGVATGITSPAKEKESETIYNLNGQRLTVPQKGLNIIGGKKVTVK